MTQIRNRCMWTRVTRACWVIWWQSEVWGHHEPSNLLAGHLNSRNHWNARSDGVRSNLKNTDHHSVDFFNQWCKACIGTQTAHKAPWWEDLRMRKTCRPLPRQNQSVLSYIHTAVYHATASFFLVFNLPRWGGGEKCWQTHNRANCQWESNL